jgi:hypothetical protein
MSRYIPFTKLKHLIFPNGGSINFAPLLFGSDNFFLTRVTVVDWQWKRVMFHISSGAWTARPDWDPSTGLVCNAAVEPG